MFVIILKYVRPLSEVEAQLAAHRDFLEHHYRAGHFLLSGRQEPRTGGVILARADSRAEVEAWISEDPFHRAQVASYDLIEWTPTLRAVDVPAALAPGASTYHKH